MRYLIIILLIIFQTNCFSQELYNCCVLCENVKIYKDNSKKYLTTCSINEKKLIEIFGHPDSIIIGDEPDLKKNKLYVYGQNSFYIPDNNNGENIRIASNQFKIMVNDSIEIKVGSTIEMVLKYFPKTFLDKSRTENDISKIIIYHAYRKEDLLDLTKYCLSYFVISYLTDWNKITEIQIYDID